MATTIINPGSGGSSGGGGGSSGGTGGSTSAVGSDQGGVLSVTTGSSPAANAVVATITFAVAPISSGSFQVFISPGNAAAAALYGPTQVYVATTSSGFTLNSGPTALPASTPLVWNYQVIQPIVTQSI
jgi:hypothetical protein